MEERTACALCAGEAALFCKPDAAFLCWPCDASVHSANFLVARHVRLLACAACRSVDDRRCVSGPDPTRVRYLCAPCDHLALPSPSHSTSASSSSCLSTSDSAAAPRAANLILKRRQRPVGESRVEQVLLGWGRRMGLRSPRRCAEVAARVIGACRGVVRFPSLRSMLAAALWFAVKHCEGGAAEPRRAVVLRWLEACSGVPARLILVAESRVGRVAERDRVAEEGSAECSPPRFRQREKID